MTDDEDHAGKGLSGLAHSQSTPEVIARYDGWVRTYDDDLAKWGYVVPQTLASELKQALTEGEIIGTVLDAGCGTGLVGRALAEAGIGPLEGIDASVESLAEANATQAYESVSYSDLSKPLDFADGSFASVVCGGVLTYLTDTQKVLSELIRVTKAGGVVIATQRTDLWSERGCDAVMAGLAARPGLTVSLSEPQPYLPGHPEYGDSILVIYITISKERT